MARVWPVWLHSGRDSEKSDWCRHRYARGGVKSGSAFLLIGTAPQLPHPLLPLAVARKIEKKAGQGEGDEPLEIQTVAGHEKQQKPVDGHGHTHGEDYARSGKRRPARPERSPPVHTPAIAVLASIQRRTRGMWVRLPARGLFDGDLHGARGYRLVRCIAAEICGDFSHHDKFFAQSIEAPSTLKCLRPLQRLINPVAREYGYPRKGSSTK